MFEKKIYKINSRLADNPKEKNNYSNLNLEMKLHHRMYHREIKKWQALKGTRYEE